MEYKLKGEDSLRAIYAGVPECSYTIIRPGGLTDGDADGVQKIEINQGDAISGEIKRADVAECAIAAALSQKIPNNTIFEIYKSNGSGPLEKGLSQPTGYERKGNSYEDLFEGLKSDGSVKNV